MKITGAKTTLYQYRTTRRMGDANSPAGRIFRSACLVELNTDVGLSGIGIGEVRIQTYVDNLVKNVLTGHDPRGVTGLWQRMQDCFCDGISGIAENASAALDMALWDLKAKVNSEPLWKTLGAARPRANVYASDNALAASDEEIYDWYSMMARDYGIKEGKLKVGLDQDGDIRRLGQMHKALLQQTPAPVLMIDADEYWSVKQAVRKVREMEREFDLSWVEAPVRSWDFPGLKRVSNGIRAAVCIPENLSARGGLLPFFHHHAADVIQVNTDLLGITGALQLADAAYGFELPVTLSAAPGNIHAHLAGAMPYFMNMEIIDPLPPEGVFTTDVHIENGRAIAGDRPGNGLEIDREALQAAQIDTPPPEYHARRTGAGLYEVRPGKEEIASAAKGLEE